jgi:hypothetical protein
MRFMVMHTVDPQMEAGAPPPKEIIENVGKYIGASKRDGIFLDGAGLHRGASRVRVRFARGERSVTPGPYPGDNELVARFAMITATGMDHAVEIATQIAGVLGDCEIEIGPVVEAWDLMGRERPAGAPFRFLLLIKADRAFEAGTKAPPGLDALYAELAAAGVLLSQASLAPTRAGARLTRARSWIDGPFTEAKELIAGFAIIEVADLYEAKRWAERYGEILIDSMIDVRAVSADP